MEDVDFGDNESVKVINNLKNPNVIVGRKPEGYTSNSTQIQFQLIKSP